MTNTERPITIAEQKKSGIVNTPEMKRAEEWKQIGGVKKIAEKRIEDQNIETPELDKNKQEDVKKSSKDEEKDKSKESKKPNIKIKKEFALVNGIGVPISTKYSIAICKFIKNKKITDAIADLELVTLRKKAVPMKGEIPHRKGKNMMSGRFPKRAAEQFIQLLKSLQANAYNHDVENPIITEAFANFASRPFGRFGRIRKKRTHIKIVSKSKINKNKSEKK